MSVAAIQELLRKEIGLDAGSIGRSVLSRVIEQRMAAVAVDESEAYFRLLQVSHAELQELIESIVVSETWFFRHPDAFAELTTVAERTCAAGRTLRVLSVPCSSGEEPYSIAMALLNRGFGPDRFVVDAVDISGRNLAIAERGAFGRNSLRADSAPALPYLQPVRNRYEVADVVRRQIRFARGNLLAPDFLAGSGTYQAIFCRNLLIYFDAESQQRALRTLERLLAADGELFVGPADAFLALTFGLAPAGRSSAFAYGKPPASAPAAAHVTRGAHRSRPRAVHPPVHARPRKASPAAPPVPRVGQARVTGVVGLAQVKALADAGRLAEAEHACLEYVATAGPSAEAFYLVALIAEAKGDRGGAIEWYRKAIYLNPCYADALAQLALLNAQEGNGTQAQLLAARARRAAARIG